MRGLTKQVEDIIYEIAIDDDRRNYFIEIGTYCNKEIYISKIIREVEPYYRFCFIATQISFLNTTIIRNYDSPFIKG